MINLDTSLLTSYYNAKYGIASADTSGASSGGGAGGADKTNSPTGMAAAPTAPWAGNSGMLSEDDLVSKVLGGQRFINANAVLSNVTGASPDYTKLFTLYQGLNALEGLAQQAKGGHLSAFALSALKSRFDSGMKEVSGYIGSTRYDHINLSAGTLTDEMKSDSGTARTDTLYNGPAIASGAASTAVKAFTGDIRFAISAQKIGTHEPIVVNLDLSDMGDQTRSMSNVVSYINSQLKAAGLSSRFAVNRTPAVPVTTTVNGKTVTLSDGQDTLGLQIKGVTTETLTLSAPVTTDSVYVAQTTGDPDKKITPSTSASATSTTTKDDKAVPTTDVTSKLLKFQTDTSGGAVLASGDPQPPDTISKVGAQYWVSGEAGQTALPASVTNVHATAAGKDGSLYVLADINDTTGGQVVGGAQDVALMKYDSAGNLVYTRVLGAADTATGLALTVADDGRVAVAGSVTGALETAATKTTTYGTGDKAVSYTATTETGLNGVDNATTDSFVTVFDADGVEAWTQRRGASASDEATSVAFGEDGSVYVGGRTQSLMPGANGGTHGGWDGYVQGYTATGMPKFTLQTGSANSDTVSQLMTDGNMLYVAGSNNGDATLTAYALSSTTTVDDKGKSTTKYAATQTTTRDLGGLGGGSITGMAIDNGQIYLGGSTGNSGLLSGGTVSKAGSGGQDAYALSVAENLGDTSRDTIAFYGGTGQEKDAHVQFIGGKAWIAGSTTGTIDGTTQLSTKDKTQDGYLARLDVASGAVEYQTRFTCTDGIVNPKAIAVSQNSSSALDRLGLPLGTIQQTDSNLVIAGTSVRTGDQFYLMDPDTGVKKTITIEASDTMKRQATKIVRASGYKLSVDVSKMLGEQTDQLVIKPTNSNSRMEFVSGAVGKDALKGLGIDPGLVSNDATKTMNASSASYLKSQKPMGLDFDGSLNLNSDANIQKALDSLQAVMKNVQKAYSYLRYGDPQASDASHKGKTGGSVPTYLTNQIANYQAALNRLQAGSSNNNSGSSSTGLFGL
ncbi:transcriptional regulator [Asticcacaulis sp. EMRT-3]|uniref:transcriptional regulator n=1 Tax=Asticcacaulis sp. EMRT-3 TaxID=3040349 RepID=UPI0024AEB713|nr:transcriptional regulator [Asticcacaulis sp. EMRT-3]MDI7774340.1 transcriptional regulator [Asticcacaulis sp. EMRT-3]